MKNAWAIGARVYLRPLERADAPLLVGWFNDPEVTTHTSRYLPLNLAAEEAVIDTFSRSDKDIVLGVSLKEDGRLIGCSGLHNLDARSRHAELGLVIGEKASWGKGYGQEVTRLIVEQAFSRLNLNRVHLRVHETNARAIRVYEKIGFQHEGLLREDVFRAGRYEGTRVMGLLRSEWSGAS